MAKNDFKDAKIGDRVWDLKRGWGKIIKFSLEKILVHFDNTHLANCFFNLKGISDPYLSDFYLRTLFWNEIKINPPPKPENRHIENWLISIDPFPCNELRYKPYDELLVQDELAQKVADWIHSVKNNINKHTKLTITPIYEN